ncbi:hypothetical protein [Microbacterium paludicola]|uniref:hypothetical protein n=1 Tax=Microbacterium paludicola TaxID=300019 RepID=UPI00286C75E7|nr:hypothetical protein [Microbacterium paludicola]
MTSRDDDALSWAGDDDPTLVSATAPTPVGGPASSRRQSDELAEAETEQPGEISTEAAPEGLSNAALISLGVLGGIYLLYSIGWFVGGIRVHNLSGLLGIDTAVSVPVLVLAVAAPAIWFIATYVLTRGSRAWIRFAWLVAGALLLVPWPFATLGAGS